MLNPTLFPLVLALALITQTQALIKIISPKAGQLLAPGYVELNFTHEEPGIPIEKYEYTIVNLCAGGNKPFSFDCMLGIVSDNRKRMNPYPNGHYFLPKAKIDGLWGPNATNGYFMQFILSHRYGQSIYYTDRFTLIGMKGHINPHLVRESLKLNYTTESPPDVELSVNV